MPARPATARFRPARSPVPSTAGRSRGGVGDEMPWAPLPARLRPHHPEPRRPYYPHAYHSTLSALRRRPVSFLPSLVVHAEQFQGSCRVFRALDPVARRRPADRKRGMRYRPPGADQLVPNLSGEPEVGVAVVVDVPDLARLRPKDLRIRPPYRLSSHLRNGNHRKRLGLPLRSALASRLVSASRLSSSLRCRQVWNIAQSSIP